MNNLQRHVSKSGHKSEVVKLCKCPFTDCSLLFKDNAVFQKHFHKIHLQPLPIIDLPSDHHSLQPTGELRSIKEVPSSEERHDVEQLGSIKHGSIKSGSIKDLELMAEFGSSVENQNLVQPFQWPEEFLPQGHHQHEMEEVVVTTSAEDIGGDGIKILTKLDQKPIEQGMKSKRKSLAPKVARIEVGAGDTSSLGVSHSQGVSYSKGATPSL